MLLDLHGRKVEDAICEVTLFLERIRRAHSTVRASMIHASNSAPSEYATGARDEPLYVVIVTGSGSVGWLKSQFHDACVQIQILLFKLIFSLMMLYHKWRTAWLPGPSAS